MFDSTEHVLAEDFFEATLCTEDADLTVASDLVGDGVLLRDFRELTGEGVLLRDFAGECDLLRDFLLDLSDFTLGDCERELSLSAKN